MAYKYFILITLLSLFFLGFSFNFEVKARDKASQIKKITQDQNKLNLKTKLKIRGVILEKGENFFYVELINGNKYKVTHNIKTQFIDRVGNALSVDDFSKGDKIQVIGNVVDKEKNLDALVIRGLFIKERHRVIFGEVMETSSEFLIIRTKKQEEIKIEYNQNIKLINRAEKPIKWQDVKKSHWIRVKGILNKEKKIVKQTSEIKDFSLP